MKNGWFKILSILIGVMALAGCGQQGWFHDRSEDYVDAQSCPMLKVSGDMQPESFSQEYSIPGI